MGLKRKKAHCFHVLYFLRMADKKFLNLLKEEKLSETILSFYDKSHEIFPDSSQEMMIILFTIFFQQLLI